MSVLQARGLVKDYGDLLALDRIDLEVSPREAVVLVGPNGSGKTTLLRLAAGLLEPSGGEVSVAGHPAGSLPARAALSYLADTPVLYDDLDVWEHAEYVARLHGVEDWQTKTGELLELLGLTARARDLPSRFSRGLRQKTSIVLGLVRPFDVLLVDEPFVGLDAPGQAILLELLHEAAAGGAAVVVATHQLDFVARATRCVGLRDGRVVHDGPARRDEVLRLVS